MTSPERTRGPLAGESFIRDWGGLKLDGVLTRARTMPPGGAGSLGEGGYVDIIAYVLAVNEFPHGEHELTAARAGDILVYGEDGPDASPELRHGAGGRLPLAGGGDLVRDRWQRADPHARPGRLGRRHPGSDPRDAARGQHLRVDVRLPQPRPLRRSFASRPRDS